MSDTSELTFRVLFTSLRPPRLAFLIDKDDPDWMQSCLRIIERSIQIWGGWYSCIIPTDGKTISQPFWEILKHFDPDYLYSYFKTLRDVGVFNSDERDRIIEEHVRDYLAMYPDNSDPNFSRKQITEQLDDAGYGPPFRIHRKLNDEMVQRLNPFRYDNERPVESRFSGRSLAVSYPLTSTSSLIPNLLAIPKIKNLDFQVSLPIQLMFYAATGKLSPEFENQLKGQLVIVDNQSYCGQEVSGYFDALFHDERHADFLSSLPRFVSLLNCNIYDTFERQSWLEPSIVVVGDSIDDFCLYYCLLRMKHFVYWIPTSLVRTFEKTVASEDVNAYFAKEESVLTRLSHHLHTDIAYKRQDSKIYLISSSLGDSELLHVGEVLDRSKFVGSRDELRGRIEIAHSISEILSYTRRAYEAFHVDRHYTEQFYRGESVDFINTPKPESFKTVPPYGHFWISELRVEGYKLPQRFELGLATLRATPYTAGQIRVSREGLAYFSPNIGYFGGDLTSVLVRPKLKLLDAYDLFVRVFEAQKLYISNSDKGNYHYHSVDKFNSLEAAACFFRDSKHRDLFDCFLKEKNVEHGSGVFVHERRYLEFDAIKKTLVDQDKTEKLIDDLISRKVFHRGFVFQCESCRNADWYAVEDVQSTFTCSRCKTRQIYKKQHWKFPQEPQWYYKLDEVVYQGYRHNMHIPILVLDWLRRESKQAFMYLPEIDVRLTRESEKPDMELDLCCCIDGDIVIGQATRDDNLASTASKERHRLTQNLLIAEKLRAKSIVLATFAQNWSPRTTELVGDIFRNKQVTVRFVSFPQLTSI